MRFDAAFTFLYSTRSGTPAEKWADPVPLAGKKKRLQKLIKLQNQISMENATAKVGGERIVLIDGFSTSTPVCDEGEEPSRNVAGRTRDEEVIVVRGDETDFGKRIKVRLTGAKLRSFSAERL